MDKLIAELQRLYFLHDQQWHSLDPAGSPEGPLTAEMVTQGVAIELFAPEGKTRTMVIGFQRAADWEQVAKLCQGVQEDLDLPAPAVSVSGKDGFQVWFSLAEPVPADQATSFLEGLRLKYLAEIPAAHLEFRPAAGISPAQERTSVNLVPAIHAATGKWSAFIDPSMGSMFIDGPWLEMAPNLDKQADILAGFDSMKAADVERVLNTLRPHAEQDSRPVGQPGRARSTLDAGSNFSDPKSFLLAVMNDPSASTGQRIKAAKALLPYFEKAPGK